MAKHHDRKHEHRHDHDRDRDRGDDPKRHAAIIERRWIGSPPPTQERYARALQQWHGLPGSVVRPATNVTAAVKTPAPAGANPPLPSGSAADPRKP